MSLQIGDRVKVFKTDCLFKKVKHDECKLFENAEELLGKEGRIAGFCSSFEVFIEFEKGEFREVSFPVACLQLIERQGRTLEFHRELEGKIERDHSHCRFDLIDVLDDWFVHDVHLWNACKSIFRAGKEFKGDRDLEINELNEAIFYIERKISSLEKM